jgi:glycosyltransferase involved in cell wall biosynthesis
VSTIDCVESTVVAALPPAGDRADGRRPLRVMFVQTSMPVGGAEMLTVNLIRRLDRQRFIPELVCLKAPGPLGEELEHEIPVHHGLLHGKYELRILPRLAGLLGEREIDAVITMGAGDKMFWGRLAARRAGVPVILAALHSTGWPDGIGRLNRLLTPITDRFIAVAPSHGRFLVEGERLPAEKVAVIPNGVDTNRFAPLVDVLAIRQSLGIDPTSPVVAIVAALRPEKNHELFLSMARRVTRRLRDARFLIIGDGPCRAALEQRAWELGIAQHVSFLGSRDDVPRLLSACDLFALTSHNEANPVSILEAMSIGLPVVATDVGSIHETVVVGKTGYLVPPGDAKRLAHRVVELLEDRVESQKMGVAARKRVIQHWSVDVMVHGYERLIESVYLEKTKVAAHRDAALAKVD